MQTQQIFQFKVRKDFNNFKKGEVFQAAVRTYVVDMVEKQDFDLETGEKIVGVPCGFTQFVEN